MMSERECQGQYKVKILNLDEEGIVVPLTKMETCS